MRVPWESRGTSIGIRWYFHDIVMALSWDLHGTNMGFHGVSVGFSLNTICLYGVSMALPWESHQS